MSELIGIGHALVFGWAVWALLRAFRSTSRPGIHSHPTVSRSGGTDLPRAKSDGSIQGGQALDPERISQGTAQLPERWWVMIEDLLALQAWERRLREPDPTRAEHEELLYLVGLTRDHLGRPEFIALLQRVVLEWKCFQESIDLDPELSRALVILAKRILRTPEETERLANLGALLVYNKPLVALRADVENVGGSISVAEMDGLVTAGEIVEEIESRSSARLTTESSY